MKLKPLLILVLILGAGAILAYWLSPAGQADNRPTSAGKPFLAPETLEQTHRIELSGSNDDRVVLERIEGNRWILPDSHGMPADFDKLGRFTRDLLDAGIERQVTANPDRLARLDLGRYHLVLRDAAGDSLWETELGGTGPAGGTFFRFAGDEAAHLTSTSLHPDTRTDNWIFKRPLDFASQDIAAVTLDLPGRETALVLERENPGDPFRVAAVDRNEELEVKTSEIDRLLNTLLNARFSEIHNVDDPDAEKAREQAREVTLRHFGGESYTLRIGRRPASSVGEAAEEESVTPSPARVEASIIFDQDGNIVELPVPEEVAEEEGETVDSEPGPVFIVYQSDNASFPWSRISQEVALRFPDRIYEALPESMEDLVELHAP